MKNIHITEAEALTLYNIALKDDGTYNITRFIGSNSDRQSNFVLEVPAYINNIPVTEIGEASFANTELNTISLPETVIKIGTCAFMGCSVLENIVLPESLTEIGKCAFAGCVALKDMTIPQTCYKIGRWCFINSNLKGVKIKNLSTAIDCLMFSYPTISNPYLDSIDINDSTLYLPNGLTFINKHTLSFCEYLENLIFPPSVTRIEDSAFMGCINLKYVSLPEALEEIPDSCFKNCYNLADVQFGAHIKRIGNHAFKNCTSIREIIIPAETEEIINSFDGCSNIVISVPDNIKHMAQTSDEYSNMSIEFY